MTPPQPPQDGHPSLMLLAIGRTAERRVSATLAGFGLSARSFGALGHVSRRPGISYTELARRAGVTVQSIHTTVAQLLELGAVVTEGGTVRGRAAVLRPTPHGLDLLSRVYSAMTGVDADLFGDQAPAAAGHLAQIAALMLAAHPGAPPAGQEEPRAEHPASP